MSDALSRARGPVRRKVASAAALAIALPLATICLAPFGARAAAPPESGTVRVLVVDPTGGEPAAATVAIVGPGPDQPVLAEARPVAGEAALAGLQLAADEEYLVRVTADGVDYWARALGSRLLAEPLTVQVFPTADRATSAAIDKLELIVRRTETELLVEALLTVSNTALPARTVVPSPASLELAWPDGAQATRIELLSVPDAPPAGPEAAAPGRIGLPVVLRPGPSRIRVTGRVPYDGRAEIPVGSSLAVSSWRVLASPPDLEIRAAGLGSAQEGAPGEGAEGFRRHEGAPLSAGETVLLVAAGGTAVAVAGSETTGAVAGRAERPETATAESGSSVLLWGAVFVMAIAMYVAYRRRTRR